MKTPKLKEVAARDLLEHERSRAIRIHYKDRVWSGIRVSKTSKGEIKECELSRL
jgi:hypothetical protein